MTQSVASAEKAVYCVVVDRSVLDISPLLQVPDSLDGKWKFPKGVAPLGIEARANSTVIRLRSVEDLVAALEGWYEVYADDKALHITYPGNSRMLVDDGQPGGDFIIVDGDGEQRVYARKVTDSRGESNHITFTLKNRLPKE